MQIHLHEVKILQIQNASPEFVKQISWLLTNQNFQSHMVAMFFDKSAQK
jgi:hypothetical protein